MVEAMEKTHEERATQASHGAGPRPTADSSVVGPVGGPMDIKERVYLVEVVRGLWVTICHLVKNLFFPWRYKTIEYPEKPRPFPARFRSRHRLNRWESGETKCMACMCCATACPAACIEIIAGEYEDPLVKEENRVRKYIEKYPAEYNIDLLKCVYCGFCVEACPCDAIKMDTGDFTRASYSREDFRWRNKFQNGFPVDEKATTEA